MIEVRGVQPTPRELRPALKAWPGLRWRSSATILWLCAGAIVTIAVNAATRGPALISAVQTATVLGVFVLSILFNRQTVRNARAAPTGGLASDWRIDGTGLRLTSPIHEHGFDWRGIMRVVEDEDRFIFVVSPVSNPVLPTRAMTEEQKTALRALIAEVVASGRMGAGA